ncbi:hypothetical protein IAT38_003860 [Cryptococcus sp. DSM 104549]
MGADGGSIPDRRDLVKTKGKAEQTDKALLRELFFLCALSKKPLSKPVVLDPLGKLYNKGDVIEYFLDKSKYGDGESICGHLKGVKDLLTLNLTPNPEFVPDLSATMSAAQSRAPFVCPLSLREMTGSIPFIALRPCGCVFSDAAIRAVIPTLTKGIGAKALQSDETPEEAKAVTKPEGAEVACPNCNKVFEPTTINSILPINPTKEVQDVLLENLLTTRAAAKSAKSSKKRKAAVADDASAAPSPAATEPPAKAARVSSSSPAPRVVPTVNAPASLARSVHDKLAEQEMKRLKAQEGMSEAVKSMFKPKNGEKTKMGGAEDFFGRTFTRYA